MEEELYTIEIVKDNNNYIARVRGSFGNREYSSPNFEDLLEQFVVDLRDEYDSY